MFNLLNDKSNCEILFRFLYETEQLTEFFKHQENLSKYKFKCLTFNVHNSTNPKSIHYSFEILGNTNEHILLNTPMSEYMFDYCHYFLLEVLFYDTDVISCIIKRDLTNEGYSNDAAIPADSKLRFSHLIFNVMNIYDKFCEAKLKFI